MEKGMATHSSILTWRTPWQRNLAGYSPWGCKESDTTEWLIYTHTHTHTSPLCTLKFERHWPIVLWSIWCFSSKETEAQERKSLLQVTEKWWLWQRSPPTPTANWGSSLLLLLPQPHPPVIRLSSPSCSPRDGERTGQLCGLFEQQTARAI